MISNIHALQLGKYPLSTIHLNVCENLRVITCNHNFLMMCK